MSTTSVDFRIGKLGQPTLQVGTDKPILLHSLYDPVSESRKIVNSWGLDDKVKYVLIIGLGLGYHVVECLKRYPCLEKLVVLECNSEIVGYALRTFPQLQTDNRVAILQPNSESAFRAMFGNHSDAALCLHMPSIDTLPYPELRVLFQEIQVIYASERSSRDALESNWQSNCELVSSGLIISNQADKWKGHPGVLIAAGPSLQSTLPYLKSFQQNMNAKLLAATRVIKALKANNITPDACVVTDASKSIVFQFCLEDHDKPSPPLLALPTVHPQTVRGYRGDVHWVLQSGMDSVESFAATHQYDLFSTGGSVSTLILSLLYYFGCNPIIFVGQDLSYLNGMSHIDVEKAANLSKIRSYASYTTSVTGNKIETTPSWNSFRHFIEHFIADHSDRQYINVSQGAHITGTTPVPADWFMGVKYQIRGEKI